MPRAKASTSEQQMPVTSQPPIADSSVMRYSRQEAFAAPTDVNDAWLERQKMIRAILTAGILTLRDRATKYVIAIEREEFYKSVGERTEPKPLTLERLLDVFNS